VKVLDNFLETCMTTNLVDDLFNANYMKDPHQYLTTNIKKSPTKNDAHQSEHDELRDNQEGKVSCNQGPI